MESKNKEIRVAIYLRVSTDEQAQEGKYGLIVQEDKLKAFCKSQVVEYALADEHIYRDEGFSGSLDIQQRPGLSKLFEDAAKANSILCWYTDWTDFSATRDIS
jgi:DNA invertase Pin-like site-specific DNA recombinase